MIIIIIIYSTIKYLFLTFKPHTFKWKSEKTEQTKDKKQKQTNSKTN